MTTSSPITGSSTPTSSSGNATVTNPSLNLSPTAFLQLMVTQLQNQDPFQPTDSNQLLGQMSEIGQLQASDTMQSSLQSMTLQNQIGSASGLLGKYVTGTGDGNTTVSGTVNTIQVSTTGVSLQLDNGSTVGLGNVTSIAPVTVGNATTSTTGT